MTNTIIDAILMARSDSRLIPEVARLAAELVDWEDEAVDALVRQLVDFGDELQEVIPAVDIPAAAPQPSAEEAPLAEVPLAQILPPIIHGLTERETRLHESLASESAAVDAEATHHESPQLPEWSDSRLRSVESLYRLTPAESDLRNHVLRWLGTAATDGSTELWTDLVCHDPPAHRLGIVLAFAPLMQAEYEPSPEMLTRLLTEATAHSQIAPAVFDLFNYWFRTGRLAVHPAAPRAPQLTELLGGVVGQLGKIEDGDFPSNFEAWQINQLVSDSVALIVALCDTFSLIGHRDAIGKLHQALSLKHRRVQTEAAAALAKLGDEDGKKSLIALAQQPIARLRVLAYAEELDFKHEISLELQGEIAIAESHLAIWLAEPAQMGLAPTRIELVDNREIYWPSYEHPVQCYLFRYIYGKGDSAHQNIAICGPMVHAFATDLQHLPTEEIYAAFAGWQTIHQEIFQMSPAKAQVAFPNDWRRLQSGLKENELEEVTVQTVGSFFGELVLVATGQAENQTGTIIVDVGDSSWFETGNPEAPVDWKLAFAIWRGKRILSEFNRSEQT
jgi:hypothetical protein